MTTTISKRIAALLAAACALALCLGLAACGGSGELKDGTYTGQSSTFEGEPVDGAGYGVAEVTIQDGKITACTFKTYEEDGTLKDENYGRSLSDNPNKYKKAQTAVDACDQYAQALVEAGSIDDVDAISGATFNYQQFQEAVDDALSQARA